MVILIIKNIIHKYTSSENFIYVKIFLCVIEDILIYVKSWISFFIRLGYTKKTRFFIHILWINNYHQSKYDKYDKQNDYSPKRCFLSSLEESLHKNILAKIDKNAWRAPTLKFPFAQALRGLCILT